MLNQERNYLTALYGSLPNLVFIGVMLFCTFAINTAFLFLLLAGEVGLVLLAQTEFVRNALRARGEQDEKKELAAREQQIINNLPDSYRSDYGALNHMCMEIEQRAAELRKDNASMLTVSGIVEKLASFRYEYAQMLRTHFQLAGRDYPAHQRRLAQDIASIEQQMVNEESDAVRAAQAQNLKIMRQRITKLDHLNELVRVIEARLQVVRNSLQLIQDEVIGMTDVQNISQAVDGLIVNIEINQELRDSYQQAVNDASALNLEPDFQNPPRLPNKTTY